MAKKLVDTYRGKRHKYEIYRHEGVLKPYFTVSRDGSFWKGDYSGLDAAYEAARKGG